MPDLPHTPQGDSTAIPDDEEALARWVMEEYAAEQRLEELQAASLLALRELRRNLPPGDEPGTFVEDHPGLSGWLEGGDGARVQ
ncbi:MAG: hypothetical protein HS107_12855 [Thermoflexaceae bacterium]|nr:hypothetical protein [Thermoflexaceae bacterium]